ncbi:lactate racemase domain-containing protein [Kribbella deserti]|uniref:Lactate racemase domain-containing protein n=1 Tax=Kribbella deserti TaxID=1926257 RepID=A0ABV6QVU3_9ACTN
MTTLYDVRPAAVIGGPGEVLTDDQVTAFITEALAGADFDGRSVCVIVPDATRSCPLPLLMKAVHGALTGRVNRLTTLIALGTHAAMTPAEIEKHLGAAEGLAATYPGMTVLNHEWSDPATFVQLGTISSDRVGEISNGLLHEEVAVRLNRAVVEHDIALVVGPVFPHEVVGFSGGNKYFFPGVAGQEVIDLSHWLGALITSSDIIGTRGVTPVRSLIDEAAAMIPAERLALSVVAQSGTSALHAVAFGDTRTSWEAAAAVSAETHVRYLDKPVQRVVSVMPPKYQDIWTAAKGFYKLEPVVADGGEVILYAPHVTEIAAMHPEIEQIGYHCRDYFLAQWDQFKSVHWGVLAHSTHLRGAGTYSATEGERCRVQVTLATSIPEHIVRGANLGYLDPVTFDLQAYESDPDTFVVPNAGETLYRLR